HDAADVAIHSRDHGGVGGARSVVREIIPAPRIGRIGPLPLVFGQGVLRNLKRKVRHRGRKVEEELTIFVLPNKPQRLLREPVRSVVLADISAVTGWVIWIGFWRELLV